MTAKRVKLTIIAVLSTAAIVLCVIFFSEILGLFGRVVRLFLPFILGYLFSLLVRPLADGLEKRFRLPRAASAIIVILLTVGVLGGIITAIVLKISDEVRSIYDNLPVIYVNLVHEWREISARFSNIYKALPSAVQEVLNTAGGNLFDSLSALAQESPTPIFQSAGNIAKRVPGIFISIIVFLLSSFFMISDSETVSRFLKNMFAEGFYTKLSRTKLEIKRYVGGYVRAQLIIMMFTFTILFIGLNILGVEYSLLIALGTAFFDALPFFGSGAVLWTWSAISFLSSEFKRGIGLIIIYLCVIFTRQVIEPKIVSQKIGMNPILTLMSMYIGYKTLSIGGMIFGPLLMMLFISLKRAGFFDGIISFGSVIITIIKNEIETIKQQVKE